tara:strand:+ start:55 stop:504 length:450 start_codon:yes stop_codon:yes gene_type:complete
LNFFLHINRKLIFFFGLLILVFFLSIIFSKQITLKNINLELNQTKLSNADISEPKFEINNNSNKIFITAKEGNFLNNDEVVLKDKVRFKSNEFSIETEKVIFNRDKQTAQSKTKSFFKSKNTSISSDGFNIFDNGNKIVFYGKSIIILK